MTDDATLYERLGGQEAIAAVVDRFYERVLGDDRLEGYFADVDVERVRRHQTVFLVAATGGPVEYTGQSIRAAHAGLELGEEHFTAVATHLRESLEEFDIERAAIESVMETVGDLEADLLAA